IRDAINKMDTASLEQMRELQLDDRALFLARWQRLLTTVLSAPSQRDDASAHRALNELQAWNGRASASSTAYRLVRDFRLTVARLTFEPFLAVIRARHGHVNFARATDQMETPLWQLV